MRDDRGNAILYRYLKRVLYGNQQPLLDARGRRPSKYDMAVVDRLDETRRCEHVRLP